MRCVCNDNFPSNKIAHQQMQIGIFILTRCVLFLCATAIQVLFFPLTCVVCISGPTCYRRRRRHRQQQTHMLLLGNFELAKKKICIHRK